MITELLASLKTIRGQNIALNMWKIVKKKVLKCWPKSEKILKFCSKVKKVLKSAGNVKKVLAIRTCLRMGQRLMITT